MIGIEVESPNSNPFTVIVWYRPPREPISCFDSLHENLSFLDGEGKEIFILGDKNCDFCHKETNPSHTVKLHEFYELFGMKQIINESIRVKLESSTLIDNIATTNCNNIVESGPLKISLSGHYLVYCIRKLRGGIKNQHKYITSRQRKNFSKEAFLLDLSEVDWEVLVASAQDTSSSKWTKFCARVLQKHAPTLSRGVSNRYTPWLNADYFKLAKTRDKFKM